MNTPFWAELPPVVESYTKTAALVLGGCWAVYRFGLGREREPALDLDISHSVAEAATSPKLVSFRVTVTNKSKVKLAASKKRPAYDDKLETLPYAVSLLLRSIAATGTHGDNVVWFDDQTHRSPRKADIVLDLLNEYTLAEGAEFWMEPGECYPLTVAVFLEPGTYLAMATFIGTKLPDDFWRRTTIVTIS